LKLRVGIIPTGRKTKSYADPTEERERAARPYNDL
jgi:hypothetical protein